ncbi:hypothetical protein JNJ66_00015 [Candidatus Saccharibacteria bacterium]|nr:hypothetical protein [Candidatus Saccharibacteria bacterium]
MTQKAHPPVKITLFLTIPIVALAGAYFYLHNNSIDTSAPSVEMQSSTNPSQKLNGISDMHDEVVDELQIVTPATKPLGWNEMESVHNKVVLAHPSNWHVNGGPPSQGSSHTIESPSLYTAYLGADSELRDRPCRLSIQASSLEEVIRVTDGQDTDDDGKITDSPTRLWTDVVEKDYFTYDNHQAVRYVFANRVSTSQEKRYRILYVVENQDKTYSLICGVRDELPENTIDMLFRQLRIS